MKEGLKSLASTCRLKRFISPLGVVGISSYVAAGLQDLTSGLLIQCNMTYEGGADVYDFGPVSWFWIAAAVVSFVLPSLNWKKMTMKKQSN